VTRLVGCCCKPNFSVLLLQKSATAHTDVRVTVYILVSGFRGICYIKQLLVSVAVITFSSLCALLSAIVVALLLDHTGHALSWFSNTFLLFGLYVAPACCAMLASCLIARKLFYKVSLNCQHFCYFTDNLFPVPTHWGCDGERYIYPRNCFHICQFCTWHINKECDTVSLRWLTLFIK